MLELSKPHFGAQQAARSSFFQEMESRLRPLAELEAFIDSNELIFRYNAKANVFSALSADYLLQNGFEGNPVYLFLAQRTGKDTQVCRTFFPKAEKDEYSVPDCAPRPLKLSIRSGGIEHTRRRR